MKNMKGNQKGKGMAVKHDNDGRNGNKAPASKSNPGGLKKASAKSSPSVKLQKY